jgi:hypothetical protein
MASGASSMNAESTVSEDSFKAPDVKEDTNNALIYCAGTTWHMAPELG